MLESEIQTLAIYRDLLEQRKFVYAKAREVFETSEAVQAFKKCAEDVENYEAKIREQAEQIFKDTQEKNPHPAVEVKEFPVLTYDYGTALDYASRELKVAIVPPSLDKKVFEKQIKALPEEKVPTFIEITKEGRATIKKDLTQFLNN